MCFEYQIFLHLCQIDFLCYTLPFIGNKGWGIVLKAAYDF